MEWGLALKRSAGPYLPEPSMEFDDATFDPALFDGPEEIMEMSAHSYSPQVPDALQGTKWLQKLLDLAMRHRSHPTWPVYVRARAHGMKPGDHKRQMEMLRADGQEGSEDYGYHVRCLQKHEWRKRHVKNEKARLRAKAARERLVNKPEKNVSVDVNKAKAFKARYKVRREGDGWLARRDPSAHIWRSREAATYYDRWLQLEVKVGEWNGAHDQLFFLLVSQYDELFWNGSCERGNRRRLEDKLTAAIKRRKEEGAGDEDGRDPAGR